MVALRVAVMNSAMSGRPIAASSAATTVSNGLDDVMVSRSISILRTFMDLRFRRQRNPSAANGPAYDDCHVIMAAPELSVNRLLPAVVAMLSASRTKVILHASIPK